jgi:integrase
VPNTIEDSLNRWLQLQGLGKKERTRDYHREIEKIIRQEWPDLKIPVDQVTDQDCVEFSKRIARYSTPRYNGVVSAIRKIIPIAKCIPRRKYIAPEKNVPTEDQYVRLLAALDVSYRGHAALMVRFLAHTGLRVNEARQLRWEHVREDHIYAPANVTKNGLPRCVPFIAGTVDVLASLKRAKPGSEKRNGFILPQAECRKTLRYACRLARIPHVTHHTFRHFYATRCIMSGVDIPTVAKWLGHLDGGALLLRTYSHLIDDHARLMAKRVKIGGSPIH